MTDFDPQDPDRLETPLTLDEILGFGSLVVSAIVSLWAVLGIVLTGWPQ